MQNTHKALTDAPSFIKASNEVPKRREGKAPSDLRVKIVETQ